MDRSFLFNKTLARLMLKTLMEEKLLWAMNENPRKRSVLVVTVTGA